MKFVEDPHCFTTAATSPAAAEADAWDRKEIIYVQGDISDKDAVMAIVEGAECVWHNAAAVGPYHPEELYVKVRRRFLAGPGPPSIDAL